MNKQHILGAVTLGLCILAVFLSHQEGAQKLGAFDQWKKDFGVTYNQDENIFRRLIFEENVAKIIKHNADNTQTYEMGINQFTGLTEAEFVANYLGSWAPEGIEKIEVQEVSMRDTNDVDWTTKGGVSQIKNQGQCGSCWAFSATGVVESYALVKLGKSVNLSEQQLVDCTRNMGNYGCNGGWPYNALKYIQTKGIATEEEYPYTARDGTCKKDGGDFKINGYSQAKSCGDMINSLNTEPLSVTVDASRWSSYRAGVFTNCGTSINHAVLLVGATQDYYKVKNSWGTSWGENGYIRIGNPGQNTCGICTYGGYMPN